jgi:hypothetical protein
MKKIKHWWMATVLNYPLWMVTYKDGRRTTLLYYKEAKGLYLTFGGKLWIDYSITKFDYLNNI